MRLTLDPYGAACFRGNCSCDHICNCPDERVRYGAAEFIRDSAVRYGIGVPVDGAALTPEHQRTIARDPVAQANQAVGRSWSGQPLPPQSQGATMDNDQPLTPEQAQWATQHQATQNPKLPWDQVFKMARQAVPEGGIPAPRQFTAQQPAGGAPLTQEQGEWAQKFQAHHQAERGYAAPWADVFRYARMNVATDGVIRYAAGTIDLDKWDHAMSLGKGAGGSLSSGDIRPPAAPELPPGMKKIEGAKHTTHESLAAGLASFSRQQQQAREAHEQYVPPSQAMGEIVARYGVSYATAGKVLGKVQRGESWSAEGHWQAIEDALDDLAADRRFVSAGM